MGLFNNRTKLEKPYEENGFLIGVDSHVIYHVPLGLTEYRLPKSALGINLSAIMEMGSTAVTIIVPGSFEKIEGNFSAFLKLKKIILEEGVLTTNCITKRDVDFVLPTSIKKIGQNNYPIVQNLIIPNGVIELGEMFASHDTNLISVQVPGTIKRIPTYAFNQCKNLQSITFHEGVESCESNCFRGTNNLHFINIPSTFNGRFDLAMERRSGSNLRGNSRYDAKDFEQEANELLSITVTRDTKTFKFMIRRGDNPTITINNNIVNVQIANQPLVSINCNNISEATYVVKNAQLLIDNAKFAHNNSEVKPVEQQIKQSINSNNKSELDNKNNIIIQQIETLLGCKISPYYVTNDSTLGIQQKNTSQLSQEQGMLIQMINKLYYDDRIDIKTRGQMTLALISEYKKMIENAPRPVLLTPKFDSTEETSPKSR